MLSVNYKEITLVIWFAETVFSTNFTTRFLQRWLISGNQFKWKYYSKGFDYVPRQTHSIMQLLTVWFPAFIEYWNLLQQRTLSLKSIYRGCIDKSHSEWRNNTHFKFFINWMRLYVFHDLYDYSLITRYD